MTVGFLPSPENQPNQSTESVQQPSPTSATTKPSISKSQLETVVWLSSQHPNFLKFVFQCILTGIVLGFCMQQLASGVDDNDSKALYWSGITSIVAWWMPSPGSANNSSSERGEE